MLLDSQNNEKKINELKLKIDALQEELTSLISDLQGEEKESFQNTSLSVGDPKEVEKKRKADAEVNQHWLFVR